MAAVWPEHWRWHSDYASYYDTQLGATTRRIHNPEYIVPLAWNMDELASLPGLYVRNGIQATGPERFLIKSAMDLVGGNNFTHIAANAPSLRALVSESEDSYLDQAAWQHHCGYYCGLGINEFMNPLQACAGTIDATSCSCPSEKLIPN